MEERLQNVLSHRGVASRRHAAEIIAAGRVTVDGRVVTEPGVRVDPAAVRITVDGRPLDVAEEKTRTILMYKPAGVLSTLSDPFGGRTVADILRGKVRERLVPVGRLDKDSEGLLLLSNDGALVNRLTHPRFEHEKIYIVRAAGRWNDEKLRVLRGPVEMPDGYVTRPVPVEVVRLGDDNVHVLCFHLRQTPDPLHVQCGAPRGAVAQARRHRRAAPARRPQAWRVARPFLRRRRSCPLASGVRPARTRSRPRFRTFAPS